VAVRLDPAARSWRGGPAAIIRAIVVIGVLAAVIGSVPISRAWAQEVGEVPCAEEASLRSIEGRTPTTVHFFNQTSGDLQFSWLNYQGQREAWFELPRGGNYVQDTWASHPWVAVDGSGACLGLFLSAETPGVVTITDR
jgi:hypothetical protein